MGVRVYVYIGALQVNARHNIPKVWKLQKTYAPEKYMCILFLKIQFFLFLKLPKFKP